MEKIKQPVRLGSLRAGTRFKFESKLWELLAHNNTVPRQPEEGTAKCKVINTPVIRNLQRSYYVEPE